MAEGLTSVISGAIAGGLVSLAFDGLKSWAKRPRLQVVGSIGIGRKPNSIPTYTFSLTVTNIGGETVHMVNCGIWGPTRLNYHQRILHAQINKEDRTPAWRRRFRKKELYRGLYVFEATVPLVQGARHEIKSEEIFDYWVTELNGEAFAFAEDSLGKIYKSRFKVPSYEALKNSRTPQEQAEMERMISEWRAENIHPGLALSTKVKFRE